MRNAVSSFALLVCCGCATPKGRDAAASIVTEGALTLERILTDPPVAGVPPTAPVWSPDSRRLAFRWAGASGTSREIWLVERTGRGLRQWTGSEEGMGSVRGMAWMPGSDRMLYLRGRQLWSVDLSGGTQRVATFAGSASDLAVSPDGRVASVLQDGDLWLVELAADAAMGSGERPVRRLTGVGVPPISKVPIGRYRRRDVEIGPYVWGGPTYAWAPDSRTIAVHHVDRRELRTVPFPHYLGDETDPNLVRRSYPGDPNERRRVGLLRVDSGQLEWLDLPEPTATRVVGFSWSAGGRLLVDRESDTAVDRWLHVFDPATGALDELWHDHRESRVYTLAGSAWHGDGERVVVLGDLGDRYGLHALSERSPEPRLLSNGAFDVTSAPIAAADGSMVYTSNEPSPYEQHVYRVTLDGREPVRVSRRAGTHRPYPSPDGATVALLHSSDTSPTELYLVDVAGGGDEQQITRSVPEAFDRYPWAEARYVSFPSRVDDALLHARVLVPPDFQADRRYPVLFGPVYSNTVRNRWAGFYGLFQQVLVAKGYVVVQVDVRGSTGYGREFREDFLMDFAGRDLDDLESAVRYFEGQSYVDPDRIGIWGSSYGGTLTVYSLLLKPGLFDAGVACAAAVDPRFFGGDDVAIVRRPGTHPEAFARGAAQYAAQLEDPLLLIHGMQDQVVPFKTVVDLAEALMRAGKDFDLAFAPAASHGWTRPRHYARYLLGKLMAHFERHLASRGAARTGER